MALGKITLPSTPKPARTVPELHQAVSVWTRQAEQAIRQIEKSLSAGTGSGDLTELQAAVTALSSTVVELSSVVAGLSTTVSDNTSQINSITESISDIQTSLGVLSDAIDEKQDALGFTPEDVANKDTDGTFASNSDTRYPSQRAVKAYVDNAVSGGGGSSFTPPPGVDASLVQWLDAGAGVFTDAAMTSPASNGNTVKGWADQSGKGNHVTNSSATSITLDTTGGANSKPCLVFAGGSTNASSLYSATGLSIPKPLCFIYVWKLTDSTNGYLQAGLVSTGQGSLFYNGQLEIYDGSGFQIFGSFSTGVWGALLVYQTDAWSNTTMVFNGARKNSLFCGNFTAVDKLCIGGDGAGSYQPHMRLCEVLVYAAQLSPSDFAAVRAYLQTKYGVS